MTEISNPYPGPEPFSVNEQHLFFGRKREERDIASLIAAQPSVLLYGKSGTGKTSLLRASVIPKLNEDKRGFQVLPPARVQGRSTIEPSSIDPESTETCIYMLNVFDLWNEDLGISYTTQTTLLNYIEQIPREKNKRDNNKILVLIFDQFEELYTSFQTHWKQREVFFTQVAEALENINGLRVVFTMREDYIAEFYRHSSLLPQNVRARFQLQQLTEKQAELAITQPPTVVTDNVRHYSEDAKDELLHQLLAIRDLSEDQTSDDGLIRGEFAEPVVLQVVCRSLWSELPDEVVEIERHHIDQYANIQNALTDFYRDCIHEAEDLTGIPEFEIRQWFGEKLIVADSLRHSVRYTDKDTGGLPNDVVKVLQDKHIIRREEQKGGAIYELAHDLFVKPIVKDNERFFDEFAQELEKAATEVEPEDNEPAQQRFRLPKSEPADPFVQRVTDTLWKLADTARGRGDIPYDRYAEYILGAILLVRSHDAGLIELDISNPELNKMIDYEYVPALVRAMPQLADAFPDDYSKIDSAFVSQLIREVDGITKDQQQNQLSQTFNVILELTTDDGRKSYGDVITPPTLADLMIQLANPTPGSHIYDPLCRSGRFFTDTKQYIERTHVAAGITGVGVNRQDTLSRIAKMNMYLANLDVRIETSNSVSNPVIKPHTFDFVFCNPPFNDNIDKYQSYDNPDFLPFGETSNGNLRWIQHMVGALSDDGCAVFLMPNSIAYSRGSDSRIMERLIEANLVDTVISIAPGFFYSGSIPAMIWMLRKNRKRSEMLMIDAREIFEDVSRSRNAFQSAQIELLVNIVRLFHGEQTSKNHDVAGWIEKNFPNQVYQDVSGLCKSITPEECKEQSWSLDPGSYVEAYNTSRSLSEDDFRARMTLLRNQLHNLDREAERLNEQIRSNLRVLLDE